MEKTDGKFNPVGDIGHNRHLMVNGEEAYICGSGRAGERKTDQNYVTTL
jgi:hypothetical protein